MASSIVDLAEADALGSTPYHTNIPQLREKLKDIKVSPIQVKKQPVLDGKEIMQLLNIKPSPVVGEIGKFLLDTEDEYAESGKTLTKEEAEQIVLEKYKS